GSLTLSSTTPVAAGFGGDVSIAGGALNVTGGALATTGAFSLAGGGTLGLLGGAGKIEAASANFAPGVILNVTGFAEGAGSTVDLIKSASAIGTYSNLTFYYNGALPTTDINSYRMLGLNLVDTDTLIQLTSVLAWNSPNNAHGTFHLADGTIDTISDALADRTPATVLNGWDGRTLTKTGGGTLVLSAASAHTGATIISGGTLQLGSGGAAGSVAGNIVNNAVLAINRSGSVALANNISGSGEVVQAGPGVLSLTGANTHTGGVRVSSGTLAVANDGAPLGASSAALVIDGGVARFDTAGMNATRAITLASGGSIDTNNNTITLSGQVGGAGDLHKTGAGALILNAANVYTGATLIAQGALRVGSAAAAAGLSQSSGVVLADEAGAAFDINNNTATIRSLSGGGANGGGVLLGDSGSLTVANAADGVFHGNITGGASSNFIKSSAGALTLAGAVGHTGAVTIKNGVLKAGVADVIAASASLALEANGAFDLRGYNQTIQSLTGGGGVFIFNTDLGAGAGDLLTITGSAAGAHFVTVLNSGGDPAPGADPAAPARAGKSSVLLIATPVPEAREADFALSAPVSAGIYQYELAQRNDGWYLQNLEILSPAAQALLYTAGSIGMEWQYTLDSLRGRLGDVRQEAPLLKRRASGNAWLTANAYRLRADADLVGKGFNEDVYEIATGLDKAFKGANAIYLVGAAVSVGRADRHFTDDGDGDTTDLGAGLYGTWIHDRGWYADFMLKTDRYQHSINAYGYPDGRTTAEYNSHALSASVEFGRLFTLRNGWWLEAGAQAAMGWIRGTDYMTDDNLHLYMGKTRATQWRAALRAGKTGWGKWLPYARLAGARASSNGGEVNINDEFQHTPDYDGWRVEAGVGASYQLSRGSQVYIDYEYATAERYDRPWSFSFGCRRVW
ncbi:MAG: autotransporter outer membrane beta-barrel domain-containing protein, partial [Opitutaceae bacterium]|nr:autotransporter outer membrane beta-barrel domain-containing protein [Opitutaceae bacterium]